MAVTTVPEDVSSEANDQHSTWQGVAGVLQVLSLAISATIWHGLWRVVPAYRDLRAVYEAEFGRTPTGGDWIEFADARAVFCGHGYEAEQTVVGKTISADVLYYPVTFLLTAASLGLAGASVAILWRVSDRHNLLLTGAVVALAAALLPWSLFHHVIDAYSWASE